MAGTRDQQQKEMVATGWESDLRLEGEGGTGTTAAVAVAVFSSSPLSQSVVTSSISKLDFEPTCTCTNR